MGRLLVPFLVVGVVEFIVSRFLARYKRGSGCFYWLMSYEKCYIGKGVWGLGFGFFPEIALGKN